MNQQQSIKLAGNILNWQHLKAWGVYIQFIRYS